MHHLLIYVCDGLDGLDLTAEQGACHTLDQRIRRCVGGILIGAWAVGGEVNTLNVLSEHTAGKPNKTIVLDNFTIWWVM